MFKQSELSKQLTAVAIILVFGSIEMLKIALINPIFLFGLLVYFVPAVVILVAFVVPMIRRNPVNFKYVRSDYRDSDLVLPVFILILAIPCVVAALSLQQKELMTVGYTALVSLALSAATRKLLSVDSKLALGFYFLLRLGLCAESFLGPASTVAQIAAIFWGVPFSTIKTLVARK